MTFRLVNQLSRTEAMRSVESAYYLCEPMVGGFRLLGADSIDIGSCGRVVCRKRRMEKYNANARSGNQTWIRLCTSAVCKHFLMDGWHAMRWEWNSLLFGREFYGRAEQGDGFMAVSVYGGQITLSHVAFSHLGATAKLGQRTYRSRLDGRTGYQWGFSQSFIPIETVAKALK